MEGFKKLKHKKQKEIHGGSATILAIGLVLTMVIKSVVSAVSSVKMLTSSKGSVKVDGYESHWDDDVKSKASIESSRSKRSTASASKSFSSIHEYYSAY